MGCDHSKVPVQTYGAVESPATGTVVTQIASRAIAAAVYCNLYRVADQGATLYWSVCANSQNSSVAVVPK